MLLSDVQSTPEAQCKRAKDLLEMLQRPHNASVSDEM